MKWAGTVNAVGAFRKTGIRPLNPDVSTDDDVFLPILKWQVFRILCEKIN
jgi:hypothetical protein